MVYPNAAHTKPLLFDPNYLTAEATHVVVDQVVNMGELDYLQAPVVLRL